MKKDLNAEFLHFVDNYFAPLAAAAKNASSFQSLLAKIALDSTFLPESDIQTIQKLFSSAVDLSQLELSSFDDYVVFFKKVNNVLDSFQDIPAILKKIISGDPGDIEDILVDLLTHLALRNLYFNYPTVFNLFTIIGAVQYADEKAPAVNAAGQVVRAPYRKLAFDFSKIYQFLFNPVSALKNQYLPSEGLKTAAEARAVSDKLFPQIGYLLSKFHVDFEYGLIKEDRPGFPEFETARRTLHLTFPPIDPGDRFTLALVLLPENEGGPAVRFTAAGSIDTAYVTPNWFFQTSGSGNLPTIMIGANGLDIESSGSENYEFQSTMQFLNISGEPVFFFGEETGTRLDIRALCFELFFSSRKSDLGLGFSMQKSSLAISPSNSDSFIKNLLPPDGIVIDFDLGLAWSYVHGVTLCGSAGLEAEFVLNKNLFDLLELRSIETSLLGNSDSISLAFGATVDARFGPLSATVKNFGLAAAYTYKNRDFFVTPLPPTGVGLSINASGITGGGFLEFQENRYFGVLSLAFGEIGLAAVGLIVTEIPGGPDFALLINIGIVFSPPIQLSMGFTLNGVGGFIAVNHSIKVDALRAGIKNHTLDGLLFPEPSSVIANAARIISDMEAIFPVADGQYVVGPMIKIAWAAQLFEGTVGIFIAFPDPVTIVVLGQIKGNIPDKSAPLITINLDIVGVIDFAAQEFTFQASLYDSTILDYDIFGDSAMLIGWGDNPRFALSLGGFHPKFTPPAPAIVFADMRRLTIDISNSSAVHLVCSAYLAVTSNSLQFGARAEMYISAGPISVDGFIQFDALFIFSPFSFEIGISAGVHLCWEGTSLLGIDLDFLLSGPTPWHAHGTASISFFFFSIDVGFDVTWGSERKALQAPVNPWTELKKALELADNWGSVLPARRSMVEMLRPKDIKTEEQSIVLHPFGILEVRQQVCPLGDIPVVANCLSGSDFMQKIGNAPVEVYDSFNILNFFIKGDKGDSVSKGEDIQEYFAPGQYWELTQDQKLSCPSFIRMKAGMKSSSIVGTKVVGNEEQVTLSYESSIFTEDNITEQMPGSRRVEWQRVSHLVEAQSARRLVQSADPLQAYSRHTKPLRIKIGSAQNKTERTVRLQKRPLVILKHMSL